MLPVSSVLSGENRHRIASRQSLLDSKAAATFSAQILVVRVERVTYQKRTADVARRLL